MLQTCQSTLCHGLLYPSDFLSTQELARVILARLGRTGSQCDWLNKLKIVEDAFYAARSKALKPTSEASSPSLIPPRCHLDACTSYKVQQAVDPNRKVPQEASQWANLWTWTSTKPFQTETFSSKLALVVSQATPILPRPRMLRPRSVRDICGALGRIGSRQVQAEESGFQ